MVVSFTDLLAFLWRGTNRRAAAFVLGLVCRLALLKLSGLAFLVREVVHESASGLVPLM